MSQLDSYINLINQINDEQINKSNLCSCINCLKTFKTEKLIKQFEKNKNYIALCPFCASHEIILDSLYIPTMKELRRFHNQHLLSTTSK